jgi:hypothetical protein
MDEYQKYIQSMDWYQKRKEALAHYGNKCAKDGSGACFGPLQVHHKHYRSLGNEKMGDLVVLCKRHHDFADYLRGLESSRRVGRKTGRR